MLLEKIMTESAMFKWQEFYIELKTNSTEVISLVEKYTTLKRVEEKVNAHIHIQFNDSEESVIQNSICNQAENIFSGKILMEQTRDYSIYTFGKERWTVFEGYGSCHIDDEKNTVIAERIVGNVIFDYYSILLLFIKPVIELLKKYGYVRFHTGCLNINSTGCLISGISGRGKSTATFSLLKKGHLVLSDEMPLLKKEEDHYNAYSVSSIVKIREQAIEDFFDESIKELPHDCYEGEYYFQIADIQSESIDAVQNIKKLFILNITGQLETTIHSIHPTKVIQELFPVTINAADEENANETFKFVMEFLNHVECYEIDFGTDMELFEKAMVRMEL